MHAECNMELFRGEEGEKMLMLPKPNFLWLNIIHLLVTARVHLSVFNINILSVGQNRKYVSLGFSRLLNILGFNTLKLPFISIILTSTLMSYPA